MPGGYTMFGPRPATIQAPALDPGTLPHLELYLRSDSLTGLTDGQAIGLWQDQSGNGRHCTGNSASLYRASASPKGLGLVGIDEPGFVSPGALLFQSAGANLPSVNSTGAMLYLWYQATAGVIGSGQNPKVFNQSVNPFMQVAGYGNTPTDRGHFYWNTAAGFGEMGVLVTGSHVFSLQLPPGGTGGNARQDGAAIGPVQSWSDGFQAGIYNIGDSSNTQWTSPFRVGAVVVFSVVHGPTVRAGVEKFLRQHWG